MDGQRGSERHRCLRRSCGVAGDRHGAVGHDAAADDHVVGEEARTMSGHAASGEADKHEGVGSGWGDKHEGVGIFFCLGPLLGAASQYYAFTDICNILSFYG